MGNAVNGRASALLVSSRMRECCSIVSISSLRGASPIGSSRTEDARLQRAVHRRLVVFEAQRKWALERCRWRAEQVNRMEVVLKGFANRKGLRVRQCETIRKLVRAQALSYSHACKQRGLENRQGKRVILQQLDEPRLIESTERLDSLRIAENVGKVPFL